LKLLLVENHKVFAEIVTKEFLKSHDVRNVPNIKNASCEIEKGNFDIILVDYDLDDGKGSELITEIRKQDRSEVIIAISAHKQGNLMLLQAGADAVCPKIDFKNINKVIEETLKKFNEFKK